MKKFLAVLLCVVLASGLLAACTTDGPGAVSSNAPAATINSEGAAPSAAPASDGPRSPRSGGKYTVGMSMIDVVIPFYVTIRDTVQSICDDKGWELVVLDAGSDSNKQIGDMEDLVAQGVDVILCNSYDTEILTTTINHIRETSGIPVIAIDNALSNEAKVLTCVQADNYGNGFVCGEWVAKQMKGQKIKIAMISGQMGTINSLDRRDGMLAGIIEEQLRSEGKANVEIIAQGYCANWAEDNAVTAMEDIVALNEDFNVLLSEADVMTMAAMKVLDEYKQLDGKLIAACADGQKEAFEMIKNGNYGCTGTNSPTKIGEMACDVAEQWFAGATFGDFPSFTYTPAACVTKENIDQYYDPNATF